MSKFASADLTAGQLNATVKKLGGHEGALRFLRGEPVVSENRGFPTTVDYDKGIATLERKAAERRYVNPIFTNLKLTGKGKQTLNLELVPFSDGETEEKVALRIRLAGFILRNTAELDAFLAEHPEEVRKYAAVMVLGKESCWTDPYGRIYLPYAYVDDDGIRGLNFRQLCEHEKFNSRCCVLVSR